MPASGLFALGEQALELALSPVEFLGDEKPIRRIVFAEREVVDPPLGLGLLVGVFRSHAAREAEMAFLRQQLVALQRSAPARLRLRTADRLIFVWLYRLFPCAY